VHLTEVVSHSGADSKGVVQEWFGAFLQARFGGTSVAEAEARATQHEAAHQERRQKQLETQAAARKEARSKKLAQRASASSSRSYSLSSWQARGSVADWLERQAAHGRSKLLVPELFSLEEKLLKHSEDDPSPWIRALWQLVKELRWGIGTFWAAYYDTSPARARSVFAANVCANGPLYLSEANARLGAHRMCFPMRVAVSPTIHQLMGHTDSVSSASFSPDGTKVVSGSEDKTVCISDAVTGECEQSLDK
jgi:WD40 repeat protein